MGIVLASIKNEFELKSEQVQRRVLQVLKAMEAGTNARR